MAQARSWLGCESMKMRICAPLTLRGHRHTHRPRIGLARPVDKGVTGRRAVRQPAANLLGSIPEDVARISSERACLASRSIHHSLRGHHGEESEEGRQEDG
jgi:hypothetical protein